MESAASSSSSSSNPPQQASNPPQQEFLMQGSILDNHCDALLSRLRGLCDNADGPLEKFHDYEMVYKVPGPTGTPLVLRVRQALDYPEMPWHLRYVGQPEIGDGNQQGVMVRSCIDVGISNNVVQFLREMGFKFDYEFVLHGYMFRKGRMKVTVTKLYRLLRQGDPDVIEPLSQSSLVELSVVAPSGQEGLAVEMRAFAEQLRPLVELGNVDLGRLQHV